MFISVFLYISSRYYAATQLSLATWSHYCSHATYLRRH